MAPRTYETEADVKAEVKKHLDGLDIFWFMPNTHGFGKSGAHDFIASIGGKMIGIETKFGDNKPTAMQTKFANDLIRSGAVAVVVDEKNLDDFKKFIDRCLFLSGSPRFPQPYKSMEFPDAITHSDE